MTIRLFVLLIAAAMLGSEHAAYAQGNADSAPLNCRDAYTSTKLPNATSTLLALQHQCEVALQRGDDRHMDLDRAELRLALLRIHIVLHSVTPSDRDLPNTIDSTFAGDAAAILATIYKDTDLKRYETAIVQAAWLAAKSEVPMEAAEAAIREAVVIYIAKKEFASAGKLIQHLKEPVLSTQIENGQLLIDLLQGDQVLHIRDAITTIVVKWGANHVAILGPIDYVIAETYKGTDRTKYLYWLNVAEGNDYQPASVELNRDFFDFGNYHQLVSGLRALGYDDGFSSDGDEVDQKALRANIATFGVAALGSGLGNAFYTLQNNDLVTKLRIMAKSVHRVAPGRFPGTGRIVRLKGNTEIQATGFLVNDRCTVITALHVLEGQSDDMTSFYFDLPLPNGVSQRSRIRIVAMGKSTGIPTNPVNDWLVGKLDPCAPDDAIPARLDEQDRSFDSTDNTFAFELGKAPLTYDAVGFPGGTSEGALTVSPCVLSQRLGYTLNFANTCYLHGMSGGPVFASEPSGTEIHNVVALNTELGETLDQSLTGGASVTATQRGVGTLSAVFADAAWRASQSESPSAAELTLVVDQIAKLGGGAGEGLSTLKRSYFVSQYLEAHMPPELKPFRYLYADLDKVNAEAFLELTGGMVADTAWLPGVWCGDVGNLTISTDSDGHWKLTYFEEHGLYGPPVIVGNDILFRSARAAVGDTDFILHRRGSDLYLAGFWKMFGLGDLRAENWVHIRTNKQCSGRSSSNRKGD